MIDEFDKKVCVYCGEPADTKDHFMPVSYYYYGKRVKNRRCFIAEYGKENLVDACKECNSIGGDKVFDSIEDKRDYIQNRIRIKYRSVILLSEIKKKDLDGLSDNLRRELEAPLNASGGILEVSSTPYLLT